MRCGYTVASGGAPRADRIHRIASRHARWWHQPSWGATAQKGSANIVSPHLQFFLVDVVAMNLTFPICALAWRRRLRHRALIGGLYTIGYGIIAMAFIIDSTWNPPLFVHGFTPGIGIGLLLACIGLYLQEPRASRGQRRLGTSSPISEPVEATGS